MITLLSISSLYIFSISSFDSISISISSICKLFNSLVLNDISSISNVIEAIAFSVPPCIFGLIRAVGMIILGFGVVQVGMSLKSHDPTQRANGIMTLAGGIVITFSKEILSLITGG